jgi:hypothetical protein
MNWRMSWRTLDAPDVLLPVLPSESPSLSVPEPEDAVLDDAELAEVLGMDSPMDCSACMSAC